MSLVEIAGTRDLASIGTLLESAGLPTSDLLVAHPHFVVIREQGRIVAAGALERYGASAVLRSLVVAEGRRSCGLGGAILLELERVALAAGIQQLVLLTQTAVSFFRHHGYSVIARNAAPREVQQCEEFRTLCSDSATCMAKMLSGAVPGR
jgi:amino-acid N-acetyltransferase